MCHSVAWHHFRIHVAPCPGGMSILAIPSIAVFGIPLFLIYLENPPLYCLNPTRHRFFIKTSPGCWHRYR